MVRDRSAPMSLPERESSWIWQQHVRLATQGGLLQTSGTNWWPVQLTARGHDFADAASDADIWRDAESRIAAIGGAPFDVWMRLLGELATRRLRWVAFARVR